MSEDKQPSLIRTAHGTGASAGIRVETPPLDEIPPLNASQTASGAALAKSRGRPFTKGNAAARGRKPALASLGIPIDGADPRYRSAMKKAAAYRTRRCAELATQQGGYLSAGAAAVVAVSARAMAASALLHELADEALRAGNVKDAATLLIQATRAGDAARQADLTAIAIAEREGDTHVARELSTPPQVAPWTAERARLALERTKT